MNTFVSCICHTSLRDLPVINCFWWKENGDSEMYTPHITALFGVKHLPTWHERTRHKKKRANVVSHPLKQLFIEQRLCNRHLRYMSMRNSGGGHLKGMYALLRHIDVYGWEWWVEIKPFSCSRLQCCTNIRQSFRPKHLSNTKKPCLPTISVTMVVKQELSFGHHKNAVVVSLRCSTNIKRN